MDFLSSRPQGVSADKKLTDVIHRLVAAGFSDIFNEEKKAPTSVPIVKIGNQHYRVSEVEDNPNQRLDVEAPLSSKLGGDDLSVSGFHSVSHGEVDVKSQPSINDSQPASVQFQGVHPGIVIFLNPVNPKDFFEKLPSSLRSFIQDTVQIVKQKLLDGGSQYRFSFSELKLDILFENGSEGMSIRIVSDDANLKNPLLAKENQVLLFNVLQQEFPNEKISVSFEEASRQEPGFSQGGNRQNQHSDQDNHSESSDEE